MSNINPNNINGGFPIAGQDNDSQGFRDNFTYILSNFAAAKSELEDLQYNAILKNALTGTTLNNDMGGSEIIRPTLRQWSSTVVNHGSVGNAVTSTVLDLNLADGNVHTVQAIGNLQLVFSGWPTAAHATLRLRVIVTDPGYRLEIPDTVSVGLSNSPGFEISGFALNFLNFPEVDALSPPTYEFDFSSTDGGFTISLVEVSRNRNSVVGDLAIGNATAPGSLALTGSLTINGGTINTNFSENVVATGDNLFVDTDTRTWIIDTANSARIANLWITLPSDVEHGREIVISTLAPITAANITTDDLSTSVVKWANATVFSAGNVSAKFTYSTDSSAWLRT